MAGASGTTSNNISSNNVNSKNNGNESRRSSGNAVTNGASRRERKQKFDVKKLLNLRRATANSNSPQTNHDKKQQQQVSPPAPTMTPETNQKTRRSGRVKAAAAAAAALANSSKSSPSSNTSTSTTPAAAPAAQTQPTTNGLNSNSNVSPKTPSNHSNNSNHTKNTNNKDSDQTPLVLGKRERKRKKFWDEQETSTGSASSKSSNAVTSSPTPAKVMKKTNSTSATKSRANSQSSNSSTTTTKKDRKSHSSDNSHNINGKTLDYLQFDMTQKPEVIAKQMKEGFNIPGPGEPIPIDSSSLPKGWEKRVIQRGIGITKGKWDVFILNPAGKSFRSKIELQKHFDDKGLPYRSESFDFSLDDQLKRLRQIWKQYVMIPRNNKEAEQAEAAAAAAATTTTASPSTTSNSQHHNHTKNSRVSGEHQKQPTDNGAASAEGADSSCPDIGIESETGQGIRCSIDKCGKLFRNDKLLQMHVKHYHPHVFETLSSTTARSVAEMAQSRTTLSDESLYYGEELCASVQPENTASSQLTTNASLKKSDKKRKYSSDKQNEKHKLPHEDSPAFRKTSKSRKLSTLISEDDEISFGRRRNDSLLSVGSDSTLKSELDDAVFTGPSQNHTCPPTPPTFRISKRRQAQLKKKNLLPALKMSKLEENTDCRIGYMEELSKNLGSSASRLSEFRAGELYGSAPSSYPPSEMDASVASEHLTSEEVVNCTCRRTEEDGLMIQCDICLCWQHGYCHGIEENHVPEKYICQICRTPPGGRTTSLYKLDQDWLKEGKFNGLSLPGRVKIEHDLSQSKQQIEKELAFKKLSDLMGDLANLNKVIHSLRVKLHVASQPNNSKVFMWSAPWEKQDEPQQASNLDNNAPIPINSNTELNNPQLLMQQLTSTNSPLRSEGNSFFTPDSNNDDHIVNSSKKHDDNDSLNGQPTKDIVQNNDQQQHSLSVNGVDLNNTNNDNLTTDSSMLKSQDVNENVNKQPTISENGSIINDTLQLDNCDSNNQKTGDNNGASNILNQIDQADSLENLDPSMIPSVSEVERLLPSIIQESLAGQLVENGIDHASTNDLLNKPNQQEVVSHQPPPTPVIIPEPKRIDKDECRLILLSHIDHLQSQVIQMLDNIENCLKSFDEDKAMIFTNESIGNVKNATIRLSQDMYFAKKLISAVQ